LSHARHLKLIRFLAEGSRLGDEGLAHLADMDKLWEIRLGRVDNSWVRRVARATAAGS
jgi:hypothetical protein